MIDIKYYNTLNKISKFHNDNCNHNEFMNTDDVMEMHQDFLNECNIDWDMLRQYVYANQLIYLYFKDDKYGRKSHKINNRNRTHAIRLIRDDISTK
jgi:hypothetical protein